MLQYCLPPQQVLRVLEDLPWSLAIGDMDENLAGLQEEEDICDLTAHKIAQLLKLRCNYEQVKDAVALFRDVRWSTSGVEQAHGSAAVVHRHHSYAPNMLAARSFLRQCRHLFMEDPTSKQIEKKEARLKRLRSSGLAKITGRHLFLKWFMSEVKHHLPQGASLSQDARREVMKQHGAAYAALSPREQEVWQQRSQTERELKRQLVEDEAEHLAAALELARSRSLQEFQDAGLTHAASHLRFNHSDWQAVKALAASDSWSHADIDRLCVLAMAPPVPPLQGVREAFAALPYQARAETAAARPDWLPLLCWNRDRFAGTVLLTSTEPAAWPSTSSTPRSRR